MDKNFENSIENIINFGDTDIFPFPFERYLFDEKKKDCQKILSEFHRDIDKSLNEFPPLTIVKSSQVGYYGFRRATLIEPFWNAYYLSIVMSLAEKIEKTRIPIKENKVFSYRFEWNNKKNPFLKI